MGFSHTFYAGIYYSAYTYTQIQFMDGFPTAVRFVSGKPTVIHP